MTRKEIEKRLKDVLLHDGEMSQDLYESELENVRDELFSSLKRDKEDYLFTVTVTRGDVAMLLIEKSGEVYVNEEAREKLKEYWPAAYESNLKTFIPSFAKDLQNNLLPQTGVIVVDRP